MRLIDADALKKQYIETDKWGKVILILDIVNAPTIDAEQVVRCKDCKWYSNQHLCIQLSRFGSVEPLADFYCAFGEKREV